MLSPDLGRWITQDPLGMENSQTSTPIYQRNRKKTLKKFESNCKKKMYTEN